MKGVAGSVVRLGRGHGLSAPLPRYMVGEAGACSRNPAPLFAPCHPCCASEEQVIPEQG